jgi:hypothetical protein
VICITVSLIVARHNVQEDPVLQVRTKIGKACSDSRKHPPAPQK